MQSLTVLRGCISLGSVIVSSGELELLVAIARYEPLIHRAEREEIKEANFVSCKNDYTLILPNSPFIVPYLQSDKNRHQEEN